MKRLGMWSRIVIVLTVFWLVGASSYFAISEINAHRQLAAEAYSICLSSPQAVQGDCSQQHLEFLRLNDRGDAWFAGVAFAAIYATLAWLAFGILYGAAKWVLAGRAEPDN